MDAPPDAYWAFLDWKSLLAVLGGGGGIGAVATPFLREWWAGRTKHLETEAKEKETSAERVERIQREQYDRVCADRDKAVATLDVERAAWERERISLETNRDEGWDAGRGMEDEAHRQRHNQIDMVTRYNALLEFFVRMVDGTMALDRATVLAKSLKPAEEPSLVPLLRDVVRRKP